MQVKFNLSKKTVAMLQPDGKNYLIVNDSGKIVLTWEELKELKQLNDKAEQSKQDFKRND